MRLLSSLESVARAAALIVFASSVAACAKVEKKAPPPPEVLVAPVARRDVALYTESVASLDGYVNADIRARVKGFLRGQHYKDGAPVKNGDLLFEIEPSDYSAALSVANAAVTRAKVLQEHAKVQYERDLGLMKTGTLSQQELDNAKAVLDDAGAQIQAARAQLEQASLNLSYTKIHSPIDGVAGIALVRVGNLVGQDGPTLLTTVSQLDPIRVNFPMAESAYMQHRDLFERVEERDLAWVKARFARMDDGGAGDDEGVTLLLADGTTYKHRGVIVAANRQIDPSTGTIQIQALVPNPDGVLRPGGYGKVRIKRKDVGKQAIVVPEKALIAVQGQYSVGVVGPDNKVSIRKVELGPSVNGLRVVEKGVTEADTIVVEGIQKVTDGAVVAAKPAPAPAASKD